MNVQTRLTLSLSCISDGTNPDLVAHFAILVVVRNSLVSYLSLLSDRFITANNGRRYADFPCGIYFAK